MSAATNVFVTLAIANPVVSVRGRSGVYSALPAVPVQIEPSGNMTATDRPASGPLRTVLATMRLSFPCRRRSRVRVVEKGSSAASVSVGRLGGGASGSAAADGAGVAGAAVGGTVVGAAVGLGVAAGLVSAGLGDGELAADADADGFAIGRGGDRGRRSHGDGGA